MLTAVSVVGDSDGHRPLPAARAAAILARRWHLPIPQGADVVKFDAGLGRIYAACSSGFITVFHQDDADHYRKLEDFPVQKMVHSLAVDTATHRVYAPEQQENGQPVARLIVYEAVDTGEKR